jgi:predicted lipid-binding transport protein (Tim44 family)
VPQLALRFRAPNFLRNTPGIFKSTDDVPSVPAALPGVVARGGANDYDRRRVLVTNRAFSGCSSAWLERLLWEQEVARSNRVTPTWESSE